MIWLYTGILNSYSVLTYEKDSDILKQYEEKSCSFNAWLLYICVWVKTKDHLLLLDIFVEPENFPVKKYLPYALTCNISVVCFVVSLRCCINHNGIVFKGALA